MITGNDIKVARIERNHMTQSQLARKLNVSLRTIVGWESGATIPAKQERALREALGIGAVASQVRAHIDPASEMSDLELIAELSRRLALVRNATQGDLRGSLQDQLRTSEIVTSQVGNDGINGSIGHSGMKQTTERQQPVAGVDDNGVIGGEQVVFSAARGTERRTGSDRRR